MTYLGYAIRLELQRGQLEAIYGKDLAHIAIAQALQKFKDAHAPKAVAA